MTRTETPNILDNVLTLSGATPAPPAATKVAIKEIINDGGTQMRAGLNFETVSEYAEAMLAGVAFPPITLYYDGETYWLADGFHRLQAWKSIYQVAGVAGTYDPAEIPAVVKAGTRRDAILHAAGANAAHGLRRTNEDKRRSVDVLLRDPEWSQWSDRVIAEACAVSHMFVSNLRKKMTVNGLQSPTERKGADGRTINTQNIGANRPSRLFVNDLKGLVAKWMGMHWQHAWPDNPSHTNGEFWQSLVAWMHENVRETWQESDLKEAIKALHWLNRPEPQPAASAPSQQIAPATGAVGLLAVWDLERVAREVSKEIYGDKPQPFALNDMRQGARMRQGRFWLLCVKTINANNWRHADLAQAIQNVAEQMAQRMVEATPAASRPSPLAPDAEGDLHAGAGRTPAPPLTVAELVEDLDGYLTGIPATEIDQAAKGAQNRALMTAQQCLSDFTYRQADLYRALQRLALQRGAAQPAEPVVDGDRPLPAWAAPEPATVADVVAVHGEVAPRNSQLARHPQHDDLFEFSELFKLAIKETHRWAHITGEHTAILEAERGLRHLVERTAAILDGFTGQP